MSEDHHFPFDRPSGVFDPAARTGTLIRRVPNHFDPTRVPGRWATGAIDLVQGPNGKRSSLDEWAAIGGLDFSLSEAGQLPVFDPVGESGGGDDPGIETLRSLGGIGRVAFVPPNYPPPPPPEDPPGDPPDFKPDEPQDPDPWDPLPPKDPDDPRPDPMPNPDTDSGEDPGGVGARITAGLIRRMLRDFTPPRRQSDTNRQERDGPIVDIDWELVRGGGVTDPLESTGSRVRLRPPRDVVQQFRRRGASDDPTLYGPSGFIANSRNLADD